MLIRRARSSHVRANHDPAVPKGVRDKLAARAAGEGRSMQDFLRMGLERMASRPSLNEWLSEVREQGPMAGTTTGRSTILFLAHVKLIGPGSNLFPLAPFSEQVWAVRHDLTKYVAWFVAVAEAFGCPLISLGRRLLPSSGPSCETVGLALTGPEPRS